MVSRPVLIPFVPLALTLASLMWPGHAAAQVSRCVGSDGRITYTDQRCRDIGAEPAPPKPAPGGAVARGTRVPRCPRNVQDLVYELTSAVDAQDANRLASIYHWAGMSNAEGYRVMGRLTAIAGRPLVDVTAVMPKAPDGADGNYYPQTTSRQAPVGLRVEQTLANGSTPSSTFFALKRHMGCLWISF